MRLRNKKTGDIAEVLTDSIVVNVLMNRNDMTAYYTSLAELNEEWEDYEEPKESKESKKYWFINSGGETVSYYEEDEEPEDTEACKEIGNYFETKEEAELAVRKLKAWKRLKDDGLKIRKYELNGGTDRNGCFTGDICLTLDISKPVYEDILQLLFGGEE